MGKKTQKKSAKKAQQQDELAGLTIEEIILVGEQLFEQLNLDQANVCFTRALKMNPNNVDAINHYANLLLEMQENNWKYLSYAQLHTGKDAIRIFREGIGRLKRDLQTLRSHGSKEEVEGVEYQISGALCSVAEIYMTDECFAEEAESEGQRCLEEAIALNPNDPAPRQVLCSLRMSQCRNKDALDCLESSYLLWCDKETVELPDLEYRHNCAKLFLELEQFDRAVDIWEWLLVEDDQIAEIHYFLGLAYRSLSSSRALQHVGRARESC
ncbi:hypothetical protein PROFUN_12424 [Planoprotostelium fungivorum]|uniref:Uncharacterized protein n=1 Tax=Planoprotostelium fungivorum TaxID=1890364 RepID=A0A2P6N5Q0_9EUKA|nr:hypothetical protein PROFUN_12424 [Planoprotostelium fungivorum]